MGNYFSRLAIVLNLCLLSNINFAAEVIGVGNFSHIVSDINRSVQFYGEVLGLEENVDTTDFSDNPLIMQLGNTPGAQSRIATFHIPGTDLGIELIEYTDISRQAIQTRFQDPGATVVQLQVRDLDSILARVSSSQGSVWTPSGIPIELGPGTRIIFLKDPDGFFVELIERVPDQTAVAENIYGASFELIISDSEQTAQFYQNGFDFEPEVAAGFDNTPLLSNTVNAIGAGFKRSSLMIPVANVEMAFLEFEGINRKAMTSRIQDPGTAILQLYVDDLTTMVERLLSAGGTLITQGEGQVDIGGQVITIVRDPNNLYLELMLRE